jgi:hypothetical protein
LPKGSRNPGKLSLARRWIVIDFAYCTWKEPTVGKRTWEIVRGPHVWLVLASWLAAGSAWAQAEPTLPEVAEKETAAAVAPASDDEAPPETAKAPECPNPWANVPPVRVIPPLGVYFNAPTGPGYYSLLDVLHHEYRDKPPRYLYSPIFSIVYPFFDADFRYLDNPKTPPVDCLDGIHRIHLGDCWLFSTGGQFWWRHMHEVNSRLTGITNDYDLLRTRAYADLWYKDQFRIFAEYLDAQIFNENLPATAIDANHSDFLNLFAEVKLGEIEDKPVYFRGGRQELMFGSQRLISPLDWVPTRRTFQGARAYRQGEKFDVDAFWVKPVVPDVAEIDSWDEDRNFAGLWTTYRPKAGNAFDLYYLWLGDRSPAPLLGEVAGVPHSTHTVGTRSVGKEEQWLWDGELMLQCGDRSGQSIFAGAATVSGGYYFKDAPLNPTFWLSYDYASGSQNLETGTFSTFNQLFPFGHYYLGWLDLVGRQNIHDFNAHLYLYPTNWIFVWAQFHHFELASSRDALYSAAGAPLRRDSTGAAGNQVGNELDLVVNFHLSRHVDILMGYSHLFAGDFIRDTAPTPAAGRDPELFYLLCSFRW